MDKNLSQVQYCLIEIMEDIHRICAKNSIPYYLVAGSMIGAVRHKGFIPWDDDIDIAIPRPYYDKFLTIARTNLKDQLRIQSFQNSDEYIYSFIKVEDSRTEVDFPWTNGCGLKEGVGIDVFVLDGTPKHRFLRIFYCYFVQRLIAIKSAMYMNESQRPFFKRFISKILKKYLRIKKSTFLGFIDKQMKRFDFKNSEYVVNYSGLYGRKEIIHKDVFGKPTLYPFETLELHGIENYDLYLKAMYGDYMSLPPIEKRRNHYVSVKFIS